MATGPWGAQQPPQSSRADWSRALARVETVFALLAGVLLLSAAFSPWWFTTTTSPGTSSLAYFYPGGRIYAGGGGGGGYTTYSALGIPAVGVLYAGVLFGVIAAGLVSWGAVGSRWAARRGHWGAGAGKRAARVALAAATVVAIVLAAAVPALQPVLYRHDNPLGACGHGAVACGTFWGSTGQGDSTVRWGAAVGWWLDVVSAGLLAGALLANVRWHDAGPGPASTRSGTPRPRVADP